MSQPEARLSRNIMDALRARGAFVWKNHGGPTMMNGLPDIVGVYKGHFIGVETKMPGNKVSEIQMRRIMQLRSAGGAVCVAYTVGEAVKGTINVVDISE